MLTGLAVGRVGPWEVVLSFGLLIVAIGVVFAVAVRVYAAGVLWSGQGPGGWAGWSRGSGGRWAARWVGRESVGNALPRVR